MKLLDLIKQYGQASYNRGFHWGKNLPLEKKYEAEQLKYFSEIVSQMQLPVMQKIADIEETIKMEIEKYNNISTGAFLAKDKTKALQAQYAENAIRELYGKLKSNFSANAVADKAITEVTENDFKNETK